MQMVALKPSLPATTTSATAPAASLTPISLAFASQAVGATSAAQSVTLTNTGTAALSISSIALTGTIPATLPKPIIVVQALRQAPLHDQRHLQTFHQRGSYSPALNISDNVSGSPQSVSLSGTGAHPPPAFLHQPHFRQSNRRGVQRGSDDYSDQLRQRRPSVTSIAVSGANASDFAESNSCGSSVAAGANCTISVTFKPTAAGTRTAAVTLTDNATGSPQSASLSGTGAASSASLSPPAWPSAACRSAPPVQLRRLP